jgi:hypothetical protein
MENGSARAATAGVARGAENGGARGEMMEGESQSS